VRSAKSFFIKNILLVVASMTLSAILLSSSVSATFAQAYFGPHTTNYITTPFGHFTFWMAYIYGGTYPDLIVINRDDMKAFVYDGDQMFTHPFSDLGISIRDKVQLPVAGASTDVALVFDYYQSVNFCCRPDLLYIIKQGGSQSTEIHVLSGAKLWTTWLNNGAHMASDLSVCLVCQNFDFAKTGYSSSPVTVVTGCGLGCPPPMPGYGVNGVLAIKKWNTDTSTTEAHVMNPIGGKYKFTYQSGTILPTTDSNYDFTVTYWPYPSYPSPWEDLVAIHKSGTQSQGVELTILSHDDGCYTRDNMHCFNHYAQPITCNIPQTGAAQTLNPYDIRTGYYNVGDNSAFMMFPISGWPADLVGMTTYGNNLVFTYTDPQSCYYVSHAIAEIPQGLLPS
jgi:hypothetical protein